MRRQALKRSLKTGDLSSRKPLKMMTHNRDKKTFTDRKRGMNV
jgi:hypothetical protein